MDNKSFTYTDIIKWFAIDVISISDFMVLSKQLNDELNVDIKKVILLEIETYIERLKHIDNSDIKFVESFFILGDDKVIPNYNDYLHRLSIAGAEVMKSNPTIELKERKRLMDNQFNKIEVDFYQELSNSVIQNLERLKEAIEKKPEQSKEKPDQNENEVEVIDETNHKDDKKDPLFKDLGLKRSLEAYFKNNDFDYNLASCFWRNLDEVGEFKESPKAYDFRKFLRTIKNISDRYEKGFERKYRADKAGRYEKFKEFYDEYLGSKYNNKKDFTTVNNNSS